MNKSKIEWCDFSWNPVTGCLHKCEYCYARGIARRFCGHWSEEQLRHFGTNGEMHDLEKPMYRHTTGKNRSSPVHSVQAPYPFGFAPTLHRYRLEQPARKTRPRTVFVCSMADLFGKWVPDEWIAEVFAACVAAPQHNYIFLTKNPERYEQLESISLLPHADNFWYGTTITYQGDGPRIAALPVHGHRFVSIEPLRGGVDIESISPPFPYPVVEWVIVGAETGQSRTKVTPQRKWIEEIVNSCHKAGIPVLLKDSKEMITIWGENLIKEHPGELKQDTMTPPTIQQRQMTPPAHSRCRCALIYQGHPKRGGGA